jgi:plasmid stabilization system protein ParE
MKIHTRSDAMRDFAEAIEFYIEEHSPQSARRFKEEVDRVYDEIASHPNRFPPDNKGLRAWPLNRSFPFQILFTIDGNEDITIISIHHNRRSKKYLAHRM